MLFQSVKKYFYCPRCLRNLWLVVFPGLEVLFILEIVEVAWFPHPSWIRIDLGIYVALLQLCAHSCQPWSEGGERFNYNASDSSEQRSQCLLQQQLSSAWNYHMEGPPHSYLTPLLEACLMEQEFHVSTCPALFRCRWHAHSNLRDLMSLSSALT